MEAFPEIRSVRIEITESRLSFGIGSLHVFTDELPAHEYFPCGAHLCCEGGLNVGEVLRRMVARRTGVLESEVQCTGYRGSPHGHRRYGPCANRFMLKVVLTFRNLPG